ncbi:hypothetical protein [Loigolactobacillus backii]|uniref:hypothetical protein n=1 Tax=Loigolactobacillus backii TaxID=375175 RepID=UPI0007F07A27|nr:hypothetical protein [Loigolactobacillus backii]ANK59460.1 hypothetical protein AYR52_03885 [Loigolactobacillus backii]
MDKAALKKFAVNAKQHLLSSIQAYARNHYLLNDQQLPTIEHHAAGSLLILGGKKVKLNAIEEKEFRHLLAKIQDFQHDSTLAEALEQLFEEVAFTWFNWLVALRYWNYMIIYRLKCVFYLQKRPVKKSLTHYQVFMI